MTMYFSDCWGQNRGSPHERDARIDTEETRYQMELTNAAWMNLVQRKRVEIHDGPRG